MSRGDSGFIRPGYDGLEVPDAPTGVSASGGNESASVSFTAPSDEGGSAITGYGVVAVDGSGNSIAGTGSSSPVTVTGLTNGTSYTAKVWAINAYGPSGYSGASGSFTPTLPDYGLFAGGYDATDTKVSTVEYINISTTGNSSSFGDLTAARDRMSNGMVGSSTRAIYMGGTSSQIQYVEYATGGTFSNFGNLSFSYSDGCSASNSTRGLNMMEYIFTGATRNNISYITIASTGNGTDFGDCISNTRRNGSGVASSTRAVWGGGGDLSNAYYSTLEYVTIASTGNATSFGNLTASGPHRSAGGSSTRGIFVGAFTPTFTNIISYITIATAGNASDFGDLNAGLIRTASVSNSTRLAISGGQNSSYVSTNAIQQVTIATTGNTTDFGDLSQARNKQTGAASTHGGLQ